MKPNNHVTIKLKVNQTTLILWTKPTFHPSATRLQSRQLNLTDLTHRSQIINYLKSATLKTPCPLRSRNVYGHTFFSFVPFLNIQIESPKLSSHKRNQLPNLNISFSLVRRARFDLCSCFVCVGRRDGIYIDECFLFFPNWCVGKTKETIDRKGVTQKTCNGEVWKR